MCRYQCLCGEGWGGGARPTSPLRANSPFPRVRKAVTAYNLGHPRQLSIPCAAANDTRAVELLRVWAAGGRQHVSLATGLWSDPAHWGMMLVDLAKHIANAYSQTNGTSRAAALQRLREGFDAEWETPTDQPTGKVRE